MRRFCFPFFLSLAVTAACGSADEDVQPIPLPASSAAAPQPLVPDDAHPAPRVATSRGGKPAQSPSVPAPTSCGEVVAGGIPVPLECFTPGWGHIPWASTAPLRSTLAAARPSEATSLPAEVDHRRTGLRRVRHQGRAGTCTAFSFATAIDHALTLTTSESVQVSTMHLWARYHRPSMALAAQRNLRRPLAAESAWPYDDRRACSWFDCDARSASSCLYPDAVCGRPVDRDRITAADAAGAAEVTNVTSLLPSRRVDIALIQETLAKGQDVWIAMRIHVETFNYFRGRDAVLPDYDPSRAPAAHAMVLAGYRSGATGRHFLLHNSWGTDWGDDGYAWVHETTLRKNLTEAYVVEAHALGHGGSSPRPRVVVTGDACPAGQLPDAVAGGCSSTCPEGGPRVAGLCFGIAAAPVARGTDKTTGVSWSCGVAGCSYELPRGPSCPAGSCAVSCAAPRFHLTTGELGLGCVE